MGRLEPPSADLNNIMQIPQSSALEIVGTQPTKSSFAKFQYGQHQAMIKWDYLGPISAREIELGPLLTAARV